VPKKCHHHLLLLKLPEVPPCGPLVTSASLAVPELSRHKMMTGVKPSAPIDLPPPVPTPGPLVPPTDIILSVEEILVKHPFPREFDCSRIVRWGCTMVFLGHRFNLETLDQIVDKAGYTGGCAQHIIASLPFTLTPT